MGETGDMIPTTIVIYDEAGDGYIIDLTDSGTWPVDLDVHALYVGAGETGDMVLCRQMERLGLVRPDGGRVADALGEPVES